MTDRAALQTMVIQANPVPDPVATAEHLDAYRSLLALIDQRSGAMDHHTEQAETPPDTPPPKRSRAPVWAFALAFIVVLVAVGVAALVMVRDNKDEDVVDEPITTTTLAAPQSTTTPPTTAAIAGFVDTEPVDYVPGLGTITWTKLEGSDAGFRRPDYGMLFDPETGYRAWHVDGLWESQDALSWTFVEVPTEYEDTKVIRRLPSSSRGWAVASRSPGPYSLLHWQDGGWAELRRFQAMPASGDGKLRPHKSHSSRVVELGELLLFRGGRGDEHGVWVSRSGSDLAFHETPWNALYTRVFAAPDGSGLVAFEVELDSTTPVVVAARVWTSLDGVSWSEAVAPPFAIPKGQWVGVTLGPGELYAVASLEAGYQWWVSTDGTNWTLKPTPPGLPSAMEFGYGVAIGASYQSPVARYWVSLDGDTWFEVAGPPEPDEWIGCPASWALGSASINSRGCGGGVHPAVVMVGRFEP